MCTDLVTVQINKILLLVDIKYRFLNLGNLTILSKYYRPCGGGDPVFITVTT